MTTKQRHDNVDTPFGSWMRNHPRLDSQSYGIDIENVDYAVFLYIRGYIRILEEKMGFRNFPSNAQKDTHAIIDQALFFALHHPEFKATRQYAGRTSDIKYGGYHLIQFECESPDDGKTRLNGMPISNEDLILFLQGKWEPRIQYKHLEENRSLILQIMKCNTHNDLDAIKRHIRETVHPNQTTTRLLLQAVFNEQQQIVTQL